MGGKKNGILELVERKLEEIGVEEEEIESFNEAVNELEKLNQEMAKIMAKRTELRAVISDFLMNLSDDDKKLLDFLGLINLQKARDVLGAAQEKKRTKRAGVKRGNGLTGKSVVFQGQEYKQARYFMQKFEITGGIEGLREWATQNGLSFRIEGDTIYIE